MTALTGRVYRYRKGKAFIATYAIKKNDMDKFKRAIAYTAKIFFAGGAQKVFTPISTMPVLNSIEDVEKLSRLKIKPNQMEIMAFHPLGTCRMARSSNLGAINGKGESFEVKNLLCRRRKHGPHIPWSQSRRSLL